MARQCVLILAMVVLRGVFDIARRASTFKACPHNLVAFFSFVRAAMPHACVCIDRLSCQALGLGTVRDCKRAITVWEPCSDIQLLHQLLVLPVEVFEDLRSRVVDFFGTLGGVFEGTFMARISANDAWFGKLRLIVVVLVVLVLQRLWRGLFLVFSVAIDCDPG